MSTPYLGRSDRIDVGRTGFQLLVGDDGPIITTMGVAVLTADDTAETLIERARLAASERAGEVGGLDPAIEA